MAEQSWARDVDESVPSAARMYDYYLGGSHNFATDRAAAQQVIEAIPDVPLIARANRLFLGRAVTYLLDAGVRQFLDIGSGIPTRGNVHEIAHRVDPRSRIVYVDRDPIAVTHSQRLLAGNDYATAVRADLREAESLLSLVTKTTTLDLSQPVALLLVSMLHFLPEEAAYECVATIRDTLAPGSYLVVSHSSTEGFDQVTAGASDAAQGAYSKTATPPGLRTRAEILRFFGSFELVDPGLVWVSQWRAEEDHTGPFATHPRRSGMLAAVGRQR